MSRRIAFFLSFFPRKTETFIHNELIALKEKGIDFQVFSLAQVSDQWVRNSVLKDIIQKSFVCLGYWVWLRGFVQALREPKKFLQHLAWILTLKHKNKILCLRVMTALLVAYGVKEKIVQTKIQYLHAHFASYPTEIVMCLSRITGIPYGATWHAFDIWRDANILAEKIHYAQQVMTCTQYNFDHLELLNEQTAFESNKLIKAYHGVDFAKLPVPTLLQANYPLLAVGRLIPKKGFCYLVDAIALLKSQGILVTLNIIGFPRPFLDRITSGEGSELNRLKRKIKLHQLEQQVNLIGYLAHAEVLAMMNQSYALVMPSVRDKKNNIDGIPNVILEAMAMQRPIVASRISGIPEVVQEGETGLLVEPENVSSLATAILKLLNDLALSQQMGQRGREYVFSHFELEKNVDKCLSCFSG